MKRMMALWAVVVLAGGARADVRLPAMFGDNMVLQQETAAAFWGWASPGEKVSVAGSWGASAAATAAADGTWRLKLKTPAAGGGPLTVTIKGNNTQVLTNVLAGEVWLCSGQSNMGMTVGGVTNAQEEIAAANHPQIRLLGVNLTTANAPQAECKVHAWEPCAPGNVGGFSAAAYFFGRKLHKELKVPVGLINSSWGGTCIEAWTSWDVQQADPAMQALKESWEKREAAYAPEAIAAALDDSAEPAAGPKPQRKGRSRGRRGGSGGAWERRRSGRAVSAVAGPVAGSPTSTHFA